MGGLEVFVCPKEKHRGNKEQVERGLMYAYAWVNKKQTKSTMTNSSATHNFIVETEIQRLNLN